MEFLLNLSFPPEMEKSKRRDFKLKVVNYFIVVNHLYWKDLVGVLLRFVDEVESQKVISEIHAGVCGGNLYWKATANKILKAGYYWPTIFSDVFAKFRACTECQKFSSK